MKAKTLLQNSPSPVVTRILQCATVGAAMMITTPTQAAFHLWQIREIYSNPNGSLQFMELFCPSSGQTFIGGQQISVSGGGTFTIPSNLGSDSLNHALLFGTSGIHAAGAPTPDFIIGSNFLPTGGGTVSFFGANSGAYTALPTDGILSRNWGDGNAVNSPMNFAGVTGTIVPEPATWTLLLAGGIGLGFVLRRRSPKTAVETANGH